MYIVNSKKNQIGTEKFPAAALSFSNQKKPKKPEITITSSTVHH
jgi:hypothetical protein